MIEYPSILLIDTPYSSATCTSGARSTADFNFGELLQTVRQLQAQSSRIDRDMTSFLGRYIAKSGESLRLWAERLTVEPQTLVDVLAGLQKPNAYFWAQVRRVFEPLWKAQDEIRSGQPVCSPRSRPDREGQHADAPDGV